MELQLSNIVNISVAAAQAGAGQYNTSNIAVMTEEPYANSFGSLGYKIYLSPKECGDDFGTDSKTFKMANTLFSQSPNLLTGNGYLVVIPLVVAEQNFALSGIPASGTFTLTYATHTTAAINWDDTASMIQTKVRALLGLEQAVVTGSLASQSLNITMNGVYGPVAHLTVGANSLATSGPVGITFIITDPVVGETFAQSITRTEDLVQYFGILIDVILDQVDTLAAAAVIQPLNKIGFFVSRDEADVQVGGRLDLLRSGNFTQSRGLLYMSDNDLDALNMMAAYASRGLSVNFSGSNTTLTMHLKDLVGVQPDPQMSQSILTLCQAAGVDIYGNFQGVPKTFCSGKNSFFDQVYNLQWFVGALQIAGFNYLAQSSTKVPQTEDGMTGLKDAYRQVCEQAVTNEYSAPGKWNSSTSFGIQQDFIANISQRGYYIYSIPVAKQAQVDREGRQAPLVQIALKEAGAIHKSSVIVYVNA